MNDFIIFVNGLAYGGDTGEIEENKTGNAGTMHDLTKMRNVLSLGKEAAEISGVRNLASHIERIMRRALDHDIEIISLHVERRAPTVECHGIKTVGEMKRWLEVLPDDQPWPP